MKLEDLKVVYNLDEHARRIRMEKGNSEMTIEKIASKYGLNQKWIDKKKKEVKDKEVNNNVFFRKD